MSPPSRAALSGAILMIKITLLAEDAAYEIILKTLLDRLSPGFRARTRLGQGGFGRVKAELRRYIRDLERGREEVPDAILIGVDANCRGFVERRSEIQTLLGQYSHLAMYAIADPHVERWLLLDSEAFRRVVGKGCEAPDQKCDKDRYKQLLRSAVRAAGVEPVIQGLEYAEDLIREMDLDRASRIDRAFERLVQGLRGLLSS